MKPGRREGGNGGTGGGGGSFLHSGWGAREAEKEEERGAERMGSLDWWLFTGTCSSDQER